MINVFGLMAALAIAPVQDPAPVAEAPSAADVVLSPIPEIADNELILGDADAPVTVVVYTSLVCEQCAAWHTQGLPKLIEDRIVTGQVRLVTRYVPTNPDQLSAVAAGIVRCAVKENQMNVAGAFFENRSALIDGSMDAMAWQLAGVAASGKSREEIVTCLNDPPTMLAIREVSEAAAAAGLEGVPSFYINGVYTQSLVLGLAAAVGDEPPES